MNPPDPRPTAVTDALAAAYAALNRGDIEGFLAPFDQDIVYVEPAHYPMGGTYRGIGALRDLIIRARATWAEGSCTPERFVANGDRVAAFLVIHVRLKTETDWRDGRHAVAFTLRGGRVAEMRIIDEEGEAMAWVEGA